MNSLIAVSRQELNPEPDVKMLEYLFNQLFSESEATVLCSGAEEPLYMPASEADGLHFIYSTRDYFSSALHEISHWCIAGEARRKRVDYGYWYEPDGRSSEQQGLFEQVEVKPQALEWLFSRACGLRFSLSVDNVNQPELKASDTFRQHVHAQAHSYLENGLPGRAAIFLNALLATFQPEYPRLNAEWFKLDALR